MTRQLIYILFSVLCLLPGYGMGQQVPTRNYTMRDGLSHANVFRIMQDERGFMVFSTSYGVSVFDSKVFHNYTRREGLPHNAVLSAASYNPYEQVLCTYGGGLALKTDSGVVKFPLKGGEMPSNVLCAAYHAGKLWLIGQHTTYRLYCIDSGFSRLIDMPDGKGGQVVFLKIVQQGADLLIAAADGLYKVSSSGITRIYPSLVSGLVIDVQYGHDGSVWVAKRDKLLWIRDGRLIHQYPFTGESSITDLLTDKDGNIWIGTLGEGLYCYCVQYAQIMHFATMLNMPKAIINDMYEDREGSLWIATHGKGVYRIDGMDVLNYVPERRKMNAYCLALAPLNEQEVVTGSIGTLSIYDGFYLRPMPSVHLKPDEYIYFIKRRGKELLIGTPYMLLAKSAFPPYAERIITYKGRPTSCISYFEDSRGRQWAGAFGQLYQVVDDTLVLQPLAEANRINAIGEDAEHRLWFGTDSGLLLSDGHTFQRQSVGGLPADTRVNSLYKDRHNRFWCATSEGLLLLQGRTIQRFSTNDGLTQDKCNAIAEDSAGAIWVGTINGISRIDPDALRARDYQPQIYPNEVLSLLPSGSTLMVGLVDGMSVMRNPVFGLQQPPPLYITTIRTGTRNLPITNTLHLPHWDNKLQIDFIAVSYRNAELMAYRYKLDGLDKEWHYTSGNSIVLSALPHGNFKFLLSARQNSGDWSNPISLGISVATPFWKTWWAILIAALLAFATLFWIARWIALRRERSKRQELTNYNKIAYLKQQALSALINPHFIFNCMNSIQHYLNRHDNDAANDYLADFAALIRLTMEGSQQAFISLEEEIARLRIYLRLEQLRFGESLSYEFIIDPAINPMRIRIPNMILQPYIENAILHGIVPKRAPGLVSIQIVQAGLDELEITIEDDGVGITPVKAEERLHSPLGMKLTEERLELLRELLHQRYQINVSNRIDGKAGTVVKLRLPMAPDEVLLRSKEQLLNQ